MSAGLLLALTLNSTLPCGAVSQTELGSEGDLTVLGTDGTALDPNTEIKGFTVFGSTQAAYTGAAIGNGNVVVNGVLAVSSGAYFVGNSTFTGAAKIFVTDGSPGQILSKNSAGYLQWTSSSAVGDNLGSHIATTTLNMATFNIVSVGSITANAAITTYSTMTVAGSAFSVGGSAFVVTGGKAGVGTISPQEKLTVYGDGSLLLFNSANANPLSLMGIAFGENAVAPPYSMAFSYDGSATGTNNRLIIRDESNNQDRVTFQLGGNVGIGVPNPLTALHVVRSADTLAPLRIQNTLNTGYSGVHFTDNGGTIVGHMGYANPSAPNFPDQFYFGSIAAKKLNLTTADTIRMTIDAAGNVGISSTAPSYRLVVSSGAGEAGNMVVISTGTSTVIRMTGAGEIYANKFYGDISGATGLPSGDNLGNHVATTTLDMAGYGIVNASSITANHQITTYSTMTVGGNAFSVGGATFTVKGGNIGVGTATPASSVHIKTPQWAKATLETDGVTAMVRQASDANGMNFTSNALWTGAQWNRDDTSKAAFAYIQHLGNNQMEFRAAAAGANPISWTTAMVLDRFGNVGIGPTSLNAKFSVSGTGVNIYSEDSTMDIGWKTGEALQLGEWNGATYQERMRIGPGGSVGIGTTPDYRLHVSSTAGEAGTIMAVSTGTSNLFWVAGDGAHAMKFFGDGASLTGISAADSTKVAKAGDTMTGPLTLAGSTLTVIAPTSLASSLWVSTSATTPHLYVSTSGNVGIGTASPGSTLHVLRGPAAPSTAFPPGSWAGQVFNGIDAPSEGGLVVANRWAATASTIVLVGGLYDGGNGFDTFFKIDGLGNTGIGTTGPRNRLHVYGGGYNYVQGTTGSGGTDLTATDIIPIVSGNGLIGYDGLALLPRSWGNATTIDQHRAVYIGGAQRNNGAVSGTLAFGNWGYFTDTGTGAGGMGNATAQGDAVKFHIQAVDAGAEFTQRLDFITRSASGVDTTAISIPSSGKVGFGTSDPQAKLDVTSYQAGAYTIYVSTSSTAGSYSVAVTSTGVTNINSLVIENRTADPAAPVTGQIWLRTN